ncbi:MAG TPA: hypothetical protein ENO18_07065, partial [Caldithrix sp.]|nr:hypothetical protein [Caldithrix sp.]
MQTDKTILQSYINNFQFLERGLKKQSNDPIHDLRKTAFNHLLEKGFPTKREEEWRFTDISPIIQESFILAEENNIKEFKQSDIIQLMFKDWAGPLLVFINGNYAEHLSDINTAQAGLTIDTMLS